ncbi:MAG: enoyl-CoA hydratase/isomerase family protein [Acidobacteriota bacterium]|nr:enoyl-CoA hydratase/isomerase family protein [Acidobacteriota bacterium]
MSAGPVLFDVSESGVAKVTLNDPDSRNALSLEMLDGLAAALRRAREDQSVRCVVLASSHPTVFSAGASLQGFSADVPLVHKHFGTERLALLFGEIGRLGKPTICAAAGHVLAGAFGIALACDLIIATEEATFGTPEIGVGTFPFMVMALLYRNVPRKKANELVLLGDRLSAREALAAGIVNRVVPAAELDDAVGEWAERLAGRSSLIMRLGKEAMARQGDMAFDDALAYLRSQLSLALSTEDVIEGVSAFFEKREPVWKNR